MAFRIVPLTSTTYPRTVRQACPSLRMPYRVQEAERRQPPDTHLAHIGALAYDDLLVGYASALGGPGAWLPDRFKIAVVVDEAWWGRGAGIRFTCLADYPQDDATLTRFAEFLWQLNTDAPAGPLSHA